MTSIGDSVIVLDVNKVPILINHTANELFKSIAGNSNYQSQLSNIYIHLPDSDKPHNLTFYDRHYSVLSTPVLLPDYRLLGYVLVFRDITHFVRSERLKDEMILQLSHELRTPLAASMGYLELVQQTDTQTMSQYGQTFLRKALLQTYTLGDMINKVVEVSTILVDRLKLDWATVNLNTLIQEITQQQQQAIIDKYIALDIHLPPYDVLINADEERLRKSIDEILKNAYNYTLENGRIAINLTTENEQTVGITISDTGVGIEQDEQKRVFERMYRGRAADAGITDTRGLGLGLYLTKQFIEAHKGTIQLNSQPNIGTKVYIQLPIKKQEQRQDDTQPRIPVR